MKSRGHIYMAHLIYDELLKSGGKLTLRTVPDADGKYETMSYQLEDPIYHAIKDHRGCFLAGSIGPDFFRICSMDRCASTPENPANGWI